MATFFDPSPLILLLISWLMIPLLPLRLLLAQNIAGQQLLAPFVVDLPVIQRMAMVAHLQNAPARL